ncbi:MAG: dihydrofolate reductase [Proteobacteria bacterium]|nr:dihydrofolate reductase [Pseudomonadota bacterium]
MELIIIAAMAANRAIGLHNTIPWQIPEEMAHFKAITMGHPLIVGRKTYQSIGAPLPGRRIIVLSTNSAFHPHPDCAKAASLAEAIGLCEGAAKVFIGGGAQLYRQALPLAHTLILTVIGRDHEGDVFFPDFSSLAYQCIDQQILPAPLPLTVKTYRRQGA